MIDTHIVLPNSRDFSLPADTCYKCEKPKSGSDGVYMGRKFMCGVCWRRKATRSHSQRSSK